MTTRPRDTIRGAVSVPLYSLFIAHTNDHLEPGQRIAASASLVLTGGIGAVAGPALCAGVMNALGPGGFPLFLAGLHVLVTIYGVWRMMRRESLPLDEQHSYAPVAPRATFLAAGIASRTVRDARDRDIARWTDL